MTPEHLYSRSSRLPESTPPLRMSFGVGCSSVVNSTSDAFDGSNASSASTHAPSVVIPRRISSGIIPNGGCGGSRVLRMAIGFRCYLPRGMTPCLLATEASAIVRAPAGCPFFNSFDPSDNSRFVGGFIVSLSFAMPNSPLNVRTADNLPIRDVWPDSKARNLWATQLRLIGD